MHEWLRQAFARIGVATELAAESRTEGPGQCFSGAAKSEKPPIAQKANRGPSLPGTRSIAGTGAHGVGGDGMSGSARSVIKDTCPGAGRSRAGVRAPIVATKRVTTVEPRGVGRWKHEKHTPATKTAASAYG